jgi:hypothetical protein
MPPDIKACSVKAAVGTAAEPQGSPPAVSADSVAVVDGAAVVGGVAVVGVGAVAVVAVESPPPQAAARSAVTTMRGSFIPGAFPSVIR